jgi:methanogenic corrinoid protein MtbC1
MNTTVEEFEVALLSLDRVKIKSILTNIDEDSTLLEKLDSLVVPAMENIGKKWESGEVALSQMYMGGKICEDIVDELIPITNTKRVEDPNLAIVVYKDFHMLGKRIVYTFLRATGYEVIDYGQQTSIESLIEKIKNDNIQILLVSVLMLNSALNVKELILKMREENLMTKVVVGGAPFRFDKNLYKEIGADAFGSSASDVLEIIERLKGSL